MKFASKLLLGSIASLLLGSMAVMYISHFRAKEHLREDFAIKAEFAVMNLGKVLSNLEGDEKSVCRFLSQLADIGQFSYLSLNRGSARVCFFGKKEYSGFSLSNIDTSIKMLEKNKVYSTFAAVNCGTPNCKAMELEAGIDFADLNKNLRMLWINQIRGTVAQIVSATLFLLIFSILVKRRLQILSDACEQIQNGDLELNLKISGKDEISHIGLAMRLMAKNLKAAEVEKDRQRSTAQHTSKMTALGEMAAGVAHEINNPLMIISGKAQHFLKKSKQGQLEKREIEDGLEKILSTSNRIGKIVSGLRSFSRNGEKDPLLPTSLKKVIEDTVDLCGEKFRENGVQLVVEQFQDSTVKCRAVQISQVLLNLLNNSYDAIQLNDEKWIKISVFVQKEVGTIRVSDSGKGIASDVVDKMMLPFFTTKEIGKGTGLGLSVSNGIILEHNGKMYYELFENHTSFVIQLPVLIENKQIAS
jgi:C4-dicarboxylate-specific signal transduction histidine kinase